MKLYRDGSLGSFSNYKKALSLSLTFGAIGVIVFWRFLLREHGLLGSFDIKIEAVILISVFVILTILMFIVYRRPLIILKDDKFVFYTGLFNSDYIFVKEIKNFKIFADKESISVDIYNKANIRTTFDTKALSNLEEQISKLIREQLNLNVECVNSSDKSVLQT